MTELAVSDALVAALSSALGEPVWTCVPENCPMPYTVVGGFESTPIGGKGSGAAWHIVEIIEWVQAESREPAQTRMAATKAAIDGVHLAGAGIAPFTPQWLSATDELVGDGPMWSGTQKFRILGQLAG